MRILEELGEWWHDTQLSVGFAFHATGNRFTHGCSASRRDGWRPTLKAL